MKTKFVLILTALMLFQVPVVAQSTKDLEKYLKKAKKYYKKEKYEESADFMKKVLRVNPLNKDLWTAYQQAMFEHYRKNYTGNTFSVSVTSKDGELDESETKRLEDLFSMTMQAPKYNYHHSIFDANMYCPEMQRSAAMARILYVDGRYWNDSVVNEKSSAYYKKAEAEFREKNYEKAISYYEKSYKSDSNNYKALLYIGDSYYATEYYGKAATYFKEAAAMQPKLLEPVKYLADAYIGKEKYEEAAEVLKESFLVYPDEGMFSKLHYVVEQLPETRLDRNWILRLATINLARENPLRENFFEDRQHFKHYEADDELKEKYEATGIRKEGEGSVDMYLEIESWKRMLKATEGEDLPALDYAREMDEKGLLEAYVFISLFNVEFYDQYLHFIENNEALARKYIDDYLVVNE